MAQDFTEKYEFGEEIGRGRYSTIYEAKNKEGKAFCIKVMDKAEVPEKYARGEISMLKLLRNYSVLNGILTLNDYGEDQERYYLVTPYYKGGNLKQYMAKNKNKDGTSLNLEQIRCIMGRLLIAVSFLHENGILHRDLKLENVMIDYSNEQDKINKNIFSSFIAIIDFGFARIFTKDKDGNAFMTNLGSAPYKDPNLLFGSADGVTYNEKIDIWSLGIMCYEMLMGSRAFNANEIDKLKEQVAEGNYTLPANIHQETFDFITSMLCRDPNKRASAIKLSVHPFLLKPLNQFKPLNTSGFKKGPGNTIIVNANQNYSH